MEKAGKIWRIAGIKSFKVEYTGVDRQPVKFLWNSGTTISISYVCNKACDCILSALETRKCLTGMSYRIECA